MWRAGLILFCVSVRTGLCSECYTNVEATEEQYCPKYDGWQTCYTTYDKRGKATGRGCSKKDHICIDENNIKSNHLCKKTKIVKYSLIFKQLQMVLCHLDAVPSKRKSTSTTVKTT
eukprot:GFUD01100820.1.p1 GENE.GFUD01100820.1~~GFUD01100820.1.p1  ORF type:complete len:116 (-),score=14.40 GFUD01100820.1:239-586(-)